VKVFFLFGRLMAGIASFLLLVTKAMEQPAGSPQPKPKSKQAVRQNRDLQPALGR